jgi:2,4-dienoyl-CoA reductase-like NADH-dependent reductase (Old Yellow Enzyme family)
MKREDMKWDVTNQEPPMARPLDLPSERLPNRLAKAAMTEGLSDARGWVSERLAHLYHLWASGGAGLLITGNVPIDRDHLERPGNVIIDGEQPCEARALLRIWSSAARSRGAGVWMQLNHAGRQTPRTVNPKPKAPSAIALALPGKQFGQPVPLTEVEIEAIISRFANAAVMARDTGFTGVQVHAAHGYLLSQFLSPLANQRHDAWGGTLENRARILLEIVRAIRSRAGHDFTLSVKLNSADFQRGGFAPDESLQVARWLAAESVDVIEVSGGNYEQPRMMKSDGLSPPDFSGQSRSTQEREAYFLDFANILRAQILLPIMVTGGFRSGGAMNEAIRDDGIDLIGIARPMVTEPDAPQQLLDGRTHLERYEDALRLGPGFLGPKSFSKSIRAINGFGALYWHYQQLRRLGSGQSPDLRLGLINALLAELKDQRIWIEKMAIR